MKMNIKRQISILALALFAASPVAAQKSTEWHDWPTGGRFGIAAGVFAPDLDTTIVVTDANDIVGTGISFENNLGLDDSKSTALADIDWRFFKRHAVSYRYFDLARSSSTSGGSVTIAIGDEVFDLTLPIQSFFDITTNEIAYSYSILFDQKKELYAGLGISIQDIGIGIQGTESSPNPGEIINSRLNSTAPLPTLNFGFNYAFTDKWMFQSMLGWLAVELELDADEDLSGQIINANVGVVWQAFKNVGFFANYQVYDVDVDYKDNDVKFAVNYDYKGPVLGVSVNF
jgi:hypothetical protein